jgi:predicted NBD/HSP70 family sugar kinase
MRILVIDVGGTHVKLFATGRRLPRKLPSGPTLTPQQMCQRVRRATAEWDFDAVSIGYPGPIKNGRPALEPVNLGPGWLGFDFEAALERPARMINDAAMQALGSYDGGRMLFLGLGTGLGSALVVERVVVPLELAHLPYHKDKTFEEHVGKQALERLGKRRWREVVAEVVARLQAAFVIQTVVLGGGNSKKLKELPPGCRLGNNANAFVGGFRLWEDYHINT